MAFLLAAGLFVVLLTAISYFGYRRYARPGRVYEQLGGAATLGMPGLGMAAEEAGGAVSWIEQIGAKMPVNPDEAIQIRRVGFKHPLSKKLFQDNRS